MSHEVTNDVAALWNELKLAYDKAVQRFPDRAHEIDAVFSAVDNLRSCIIQIDGIANKQTPHGPYSVDLIDELHSILWSNIEAFDSLSQHSTALYTWRDDPVSWRGKPISNILEAIRNEALQYHEILKNCSQQKSFAPSDSLRERHPGPWFDISGVQDVARKIRERLNPSSRIGSGDSGRKPDADRTQGKNSGKNFRPWDANCERIAKAYIRQCVNNGSEIARLPFIKEELRKNATRYPKAKAASTIDRAFRENEGCWQPALLKALSERTQTGRKK